ncbi:Serine/threonine-protein kinase [Dimargaris verticillata]|uniref:non-specific serine/threonine protein kinase n=1 Tax=Dimargaris verticillata TaxID=2761393 RepID=A0A9W8E8F2_9FUNG|nr:Serine/threonine-protein kinase [Dimargaris verticillata]
MASEPTRFPAPPPGPAQYAPPHNTSRSRHSHGSRSRRVVGRYQFTKTIGAGSMGKVKLAVDLTTGEKVAVKIMPRQESDASLRTATVPIPGDRPMPAAHPGASTSAASRSDATGGEPSAGPAEHKDVRILREIAIMKLLNHPYIVGLKDVIVHPTHYYVVLEYVSGGQMLDYIISHGRLKEKHARKFARQILSALDYCHRNSIVHRDLKIENILISSSATIKIIDFGLSNLYSLRSRLSTFCGSLYFAAPELLSAKAYVGPEVDIWSFGIVLYVLVCGKVPFDDQSMPALHAKIKRGHVEYPSWLTHECKHLLSRILVTNPDDRATMAEIMRHPWMNRHYDAPVENYLPLRLPLTLPLDPVVLRQMADFGFGLEADLSLRMETLLASEWYLKQLQRYYPELFASPTSPGGTATATVFGSAVARSAEHMALAARDALKKRTSFWRRPNPATDDSLALDPLLSMYYLVAEKMQADTGFHVSGAPLAVEGLAAADRQPSSTNGTVERPAEARLEAISTPLPVPTEVASQTPSVHPPALELAGGSASRPSMNSATLAAKPQPVTIGADNPAEGATTPRKSLKVSEGVLRRLSRAIRSSRNKQKNKPPVSPSAVAFSSSTDPPVSPAAGPTTYSPDVIAAQPDLNASRVTVTSHGEKKKQHRLSTFLGKKAKGSIPSLAKASVTTAPTEHIANDQAAPADDADSAVATEPESGADGATPTKPTAAVSPGAGHDVALLARPHHHSHGSRQTIASSRSADSRDGVSFSASQLASAPMKSPGPHTSNLKLGRRISSLLTRATSVQDRQRVSSQRLPSPAGLDRSPQPFSLRFRASQGSRAAQSPSGRAESFPADHARHNHSSVDCGPLTEARVAGNPVAAGNHSAVVYSRGGLAQMESGVEARSGGFATSLHTGDDASHHRRFTAQQPSPLTPTVPRRLASHHETPSPALPHRTRSARFRPKSREHLAPGKAGSLVDPATAADAVAVLQKQKHSHQHRADDHIRPVFLKGLFSVSTTSTRSPGAIRRNIMAALDKFDINYRECQGYFECIVTQFPLRAKSGLTSTGHPLKQAKAPRPIPADANGDSPTGSSPGTVPRHPSQANSLSGSGSISPGVSADASGPNPGALGLSSSVPLGGPLMITHPNNVPPYTASNSILFFDDDDRLSAFSLVTGSQGMAKTMSHPTPGLSAKSSLQSRQALDRSPNPAEGIALSRQSLDDVSPVGTLNAANGVPIPKRSLDRPNVRWGEAIATPEGETAAVPPRTELVGPPPLAKSPRPASGLYASPMSAIAEEDAASAAGREQTRTVSGSTCQSGAGPHSESATRPSDGRGTAKLTEATTSATEDRRIINPFYGTNQSPSTESPRAQSLYARVETVGSGGDGGERSRGSSVRAQRHSAGPVNANWTFVRFEVYIVKMPWLLGLHGLQFRQVVGPAWQYKHICSTLLKELHL